MNLKPENTIEKLDSFGEPSFRHEPDSESIEMIKYSDGVDFFVEECIKGDKIKTDSVSIHFPLGTFSQIENGMNVMMDRYYIPHKMCDFIEIRFGFYPEDLTFYEDIEKERVGGSLINRARKNMKMDLSKLGRLIGKNEDKMEVIEDVGTRQEKVIRSLRKEVAKRIGEASIGTKRELKCRVTDIKRIDKWRLEHDFYNLESEKHVAGHGINKSQSPMWEYSLVTHNMNDEIRVMTRSEARDYFERPVVGK